MKRSLHVFETGFELSINNKVWIFCDPVSFGFFLSLYDQPYLSVVFLSLPIFIEIGGAFNKFPDFFCTGI